MKIKEMRKVLASKGISVCRITDVIVRMRKLYWELSDLFGYIPSHNEVDQGRWFEKAMSCGFNVLSDQLPYNELFEFYLELLKIQFRDLKEGERTGLGFISIDGIISC